VLVFVSTWTRVIKLGDVVVRAFHHVSVHHIVTEGVRAESILRSTLEHVLLLSGLDWVVRPTIRLRSGDISEA